MTSLRCRISLAIGLLGACQREPRRDEKPAHTIAVPHLDAAVATQQPDAGRLDAAIAHIDNMKWGHLKKHVEGCVAVPQATIDIPVPDGVLIQARWSGGPRGTHGFRIYEDGRREKARNTEPFRWKPAPALGPKEMATLRALIKRSRLERLDPYYASEGGPAPDAGQDIIQVREADGVRSMGRDGNCEVREIDRILDFLFKLPGLDP